MVARPATCSPTRRAVNVRATSRQPTNRAVISLATNPKPRQFHRMSEVSPNSLNAGQLMMARLNPVEVFSALGSDVRWQIIQMLISMAGHSLPWTWLRHWGGIRMAWASSCGCCVIAEWCLARQARTAGWHCFIFPRRTGPLQACWITASARSGLNDFSRSAAGSPETFRVLCQKKKRAPLLARSFAIFLFMELAFRTRERSALFRRERRRGLRLWPRRRRSTAV